MRVKFTPFSTPKNLHNTKKTMSATLEVFYTSLLPIFAVVALSAVAARWIKIDTSMLSRITIYLFSPFLILGSIASSDLAQSEVAAISAMAILSGLIMVALGWTIARLMHFDRKLEGAFILSVFMGNTGGIGLPLIAFAYGEAGLQRGVLFFAVSAVITNTFGIYLASRSASSVKTSIRNVVISPLPYVTILALAINFYKIALPLPVERVAAILGPASIPCMLVILGAQIAEMKLDGKFGAVALASGIRLVAAPLVGFGLAALLGVEGLAKQASIIEISTPAAMLSAVYATEYGSDSQFATAVVLVSSLASTFTLSYLLTIL